MKRILITFLVIVSFTLQGKSQKTEILHLSVGAGNFERINTPVSFGLESISISDTATLQLFEKVNGNLIQKAFQIESGYIPRLWWILDGTTNSGRFREYLLYKDVPQRIENKITTVITPESIVLKNGDSEILHYQTAVLYPPAKIDTVFKRSGFIHPLITPSGNILTRVSPPDHYHHVGIWNPWTRVRIGNHVTDFWNLYEKQGTVRFAGINSIVNGPVYGGFSVRQQHIDFQGKKPEETAINEVWDVRAWSAAPVVGLKAWLVDLTTFLSVPGDSAIVFEAYRYGGGIGIRATEEWTNVNSSVLTSEGKTRKDADGTRARWTDLNGAFKNNGQSGVVFFSHPSNREHPEPMRVWPENMNNNRGDVFFEFCPIRYKEWVLNTDRVYMLKYRMLVYDGNLDKTIADRIWNDFAYPPVVKVLTK